MSIAASNHVNGLMAVYSQSVLRCKIEAPFSKYSALVTAIDRKVVDRDAKIDPPVYALYNLSGGA